MSLQRNSEPLERPLAPRSLIASLLLRTSPPRMPAARLVQWCELFGVPAGTARVALSRMVERGELRADDGVYELAGRVGGRRRAQDWSIAPKLRAWDGAWQVAIVTGAARAAADRSALRDAMRRLRMAELREGVWTRPDNLPRAAAPGEAWDIAGAQCAWWRGEPDGDAERLASALFDPAGWAQRARRLRTQLGRVTEGLDDHAAGDRLADAFPVGAAAVAHLRADPLLPPELGPSTDAGDALREMYQAYEAAFTTALRAWFRSHA